MNSGGREKKGMGQREKEKHCLLVPVLLYWWYTSLLILQHNTRTRTLTAVAVASLLLRLCLYVFCVAYNMLSPLPMMTTNDIVDYKNIPIFFDATIISVTHRRHAMCCVCCVCSMCVCFQHTYHILHSHTRLQISRCTWMRRFYGAVLCAHKIITWDEAGNL